MDPMRVAEDLQSRSPPAVFAGMLMLTVGLAIAIPVPVLVPGPWRAIGFVPVVAGVALHRAATSHLRRAGTPVAAWQRPATLVEVTPEVDPKIMGLPRYFWERGSLRSVNEYP